MSLEQNLKVVKVRAIEVAKCLEASTRSLIAFDEAISDLFCDAGPRAEDPPFDPKRGQQFLSALAKSATNEGVSSLDVMRMIGMDGHHAGPFMRSLRNRIRENGIDPGAVFFGIRQSVDGVQVTRFFAGKSLAEGIAALARNLG